jgi:2-polyprenyl-3-methyl-5-hydroxy-6-metoxy-1,4-benzoquinol methylase
VSHADQRALYDEVSRRRKAQKIGQILKERVAADLSQLSGLDVGCSSGLINQALRDRFAILLGVDVDFQAVRHAARLDGPGAGSRFAVADGGRLPFDAEQFDVVICAQVYEHVSDQQALADEIWRVLKVGGVCFLSGPNRLAVMEEHYWLPFLSWLPRSLAHRYMRLARRGREYDAFPRTVWTLRRLWRKFEIEDLTVSMIREPERYGVTDQVQRFGLLRHIPRPVLQTADWLIPNYNWILRKLASSVTGPN